MFVFLFNHLQVDVKMFHSKNIFKWKNEIILSVIIINNSFPFQNLITSLVFENVFRNIINSYKNHIKSEVGVYTYYCREYDKCSIGEISRLIKKYIYEYILDFKMGDDRNVLMKHNSKTKPSFNFKDSKILFFNLSLLIKLVVNRYYYVLCLN